MLWRAEGPTSGRGTAAVGENHLVGGGNRKGETGLMCYRISPSGAKRIWHLPPEKSTVRSCSPVIMNNHVYALTSPPPEKKKGKLCYLLCIELETGNIAATTNLSFRTCGSPIGAGGRIFYEKYLDIQGINVYNADPKDFNLVGMTPMKNQARSAGIAISGGRFFVRMWDGIDPVSVEP